MAGTLEVLVSGARGRHGGAVARVLVERGHRVRALTAKPDSKRAKRLKELGAEIVGVDVGDDKGLAKAMRGIDAVFATATVAEAGDETRNGINLVDTAQAAGVGHIVYGSVAGVERASDLGHLSSKYVVEQHIKSLPIPYTIVAPAFFMENFLGEHLVDGLRESRLALPLPEASRLPQVSLADAAELVAVAIEERERFLSKRFELVADSPTGAELAAAIAKASGRPVGYGEVPLDEFAAVSADLAQFCGWFCSGQAGDSWERAAERFPDIQWKGFAEWAAMQDWNLGEQRRSKPRSRRGRA